MPAAARSAADLPSAGDTHRVDMMRDRPETPPMSTPLPPVVPPPSMSERFDVVYRRRGAPAVGAATPFGWDGRGTADIDGDTLVLRGRRPRAFRSSVAERWSIPLHAIANVQVFGAEVRFDARSPTGVHAVRLLTTGEVDAARFAMRLPAHVSAEFVAEQADLDAFHTRLARSGGTAWVTTAVIAANVVVFARMALDGAGILSPNTDVILRWGSNFGPLTMSGQWWRLFTATFIHFGVLHLALNMWALYGAGDLCERLFGRARFAALYVFAGLAGSVGSLLWNPGVNSAGASGAIFGVYGALLAYVLDRRNGVPRSVIAMHRQGTLAFVGYNLVYGAIHPGIDNAAHIGGLLGGVIAGFALARPVDRTRESRGGTVRMLAAAVLLGLAAVPLLRPSPATQARQQFTRAMLDFPEREHAAVEAMNRAFALGRPGTQASDVAVANALRQDVVPKWAALHDALVIDAPLPAADAKRHALLLRYIDGRRDQADLLARSVFEHAPALQARATAAGRQADAALAELNADGN